MFKKILNFFGSLFGFKWYDTVDIRCPKCGKKAIITSEVIQNEATDSISGEKFDRFVYSINCPNPKCGCAGALTEIWEQEIPNEEGNTPIKLVVHNKKSQLSNEELKQKLKDDREDIIKEVTEQMKELGASEEEIEKMIEDLNKQLDMLDDEDIKDDDKKE